MLNHRNELHPFAAACIGITVTLMMIGCEGSARRYHPFNGVTGYTQSKLPGDEYEVKFTSAQEEDPKKTEFYAKVHAAELTLAKGSSFFEVVQMNDERIETTVQQPGGVDMSEVETRPGGAMGMPQHVAKIKPVPPTKMTYVSLVCRLVIRLHDKECEKCVDAQKIFVDARAGGLPVIEARHESE